MSTGSTPWDKRILHRSFLHNPTSVLGFCWDGWSGFRSHLPSLFCSRFFSHILDPLSPHTCLHDEFPCFFILCNLDWRWTFQIVSAGSSLSSSPVFNMSFSSSILLLGQEVLFGNILSSIYKFIACVFCFPPEWKNTIQPSFLPLYNKKITFSLIPSMFLIFF